MCKSKRRRKQQFQVRRRTEILDSPRPQILRDRDGQLIAQRKNLTLILLQILVQILLPSRTTTHLPIHHPPLRLPQPPRRPAQPPRQIPPRLPPDPHRLADQARPPVPSPPVPEPLLQHRVLEPRVGRKLEADQDAARISLRRRARPDSIVGIRACAGSRSGRGTDGRSTRDLEAFDADVGQGRGQDLAVGRLDVGVDVRRGLLEDEGPEVGDACGQEGAFGVEGVEEEGLFADCVGGLLAVRVVRTGVGRVEGGRLVEAGIVENERIEYLVCTHESRRRHRQTLVRARPVLRT